MPKPTKHVEMPGREPCETCGTQGGPMNPFRVAFVNGAWQYKCIPCSGQPLSNKEMMLLMMSVLTPPPERI